MQVRIVLALNQGAEGFAVSSWTIATANPADQLTPQERAALDHTVDQARFEIETKWKDDFRGTIKARQVPMELRLLSSDLQAPSQDLLVFHIGDYMRAAIKTARDLEDLRDRQQSERLRFPPRPGKTTEQELARETTYLRDEIPSIRKQMKAGLDEQTTTQSKLGQFAALMATSPEPDPGGWNKPEFYLQQAEKSLAAEDPRTANEFMVSARGALKDQQDWWENYKRHYAFGDEVISPVFWQAFSLLSLGIVDEELFDLSAESAKKGFVNQLLVVGKTVFERVGNLLSFGAYEGWKAGVERRIEEAPDDPLWRAMVAAGPDAVQGVIDTMAPIAEIETMAGMPTIGPAGQTIKPDFWAKVGAFFSAVMKIAMLGEMAKGRGKGKGREQGKTGGGKSGAEKGGVEQKAAPEQKGGAEKSSVEKSSVEKSSVEQKGAPEQKGGTPSAEEPVKVAPTESPPGPVAAEEKIGTSRKTMTGAGEPPEKTGAPRPNQPPAGERLQAAMREEAEHGLAPRAAPETPAEVKSGKREPRYKAAKEGSRTVGKPVASLEEARRQYDDVIAETSGKHEVGIWQKEDGSYVVRLGQTSEVDAPRDWRPVQHYHTNAPDIPLWRMPARADVQETSIRAAGSGHPVTEIVEYPLPDGKRGRAAYTVNPDQSVKIEFVDPSGKKVPPKEFKSVKEYNEYYESHKVFADSETAKALIAEAERALGKTPASSENVTTKTNFGGPKTSTKPSAALPKPEALEQPKPSEDFVAQQKTLAKEEKKRALAELERIRNERSKRPVMPEKPPAGPPMTAKEALKSLGEEARKDSAEIPQKKNDADPLVAVRVQSDTKTKGQYWVEGSKEYERAYEGKGLKKKLKPEFVVMPTSQAEALRFRKAGDEPNYKIKPRMEGEVQLESSGAGRRIGHDIVARARIKETEEKNKSSFVRTTGADLLQARGYNWLLTKKEPKPGSTPPPPERGILRPGNISAGGVDAITAEISGGKAKIYLNDFTDQDTSKPKKPSHKKWYKELLDAVAKNRLDFSDKPTEAAIKQAIEDGEVYVRTVRVDQSSLEVTPGTPEKLKTGRRK